MDIIEFQNVCLQAHNEYRRKHGAPPLKLNQNICKISQEWANYLSSTNQFIHSNKSGYGENLYVFQSTNINATISGRDAVKSWYDEIQFYNFQSGTFSMKTGHFTQVVWKDSTELGVAFAKRGGRIVVVANYTPPGNFMGRFKENVLPLGTPVSGGTSTSSATTNTSTNSGVMDVPTFERECLEAHNEYRQKHGAPPLKLNKEICRISQEWANNLISSSTFKHSNNKGYGENLYAFQSSDRNATISGREPVKNWYNEIKDYNFARADFSSNTGHFTQVVWKSSTELGVAFAKSGGKIIVVANYSPPGNYLGQFKQNVLPLGTKPPINSGNIDTVVSKMNDLTVNTGDFSSFAVESLTIHNELRRKHGVPGLVLNKEMCDFAENWAYECARNHNFVRKTDHSYGSNLYMISSTNKSFSPTPREIIDKWYDESEEFRYNSENVNNNLLHFTQVIWKRTTDFGMGIAKNDKGEHYIVALYNPRGNFIGEFAKNVPPPK